MKTMSQIAKMDREITNHCLRGYKTNIPEHKKGRKKDMDYVNFRCEGKFENYQKKWR